MLAVVGKVSLKSIGATLLPLLVQEVIVVATVDPVPIFQYYCSITVISYCYFNCNKIVTLLQVTTKSGTGSYLHSGTVDLLHF
jgi:hypothetical protein